MKKLLASLLVIGIVFTGTSLWAASATGTYTWKQVIPSPASVFGGWEIWMSDTQTGTYTLLVTVPYVATQTTYTATQVITVPDGVVTTKWFKILAWNKSGKKSAFTAPISASVDFEPVPTDPTLFTVTITIST